LLGLAQAHVPVGRGSAHDARAARRVLVEGNRGVTDCRAVGFVRLGEVGFLFRREALEIGPALNLERRDVVRIRHATAELLVLAQSRIRVGGGGADERVRVSGVLIIRNRRIADVDAVRLVVLDEVGLFLVHETLEVRPRLKLETGNVVRSGRAEAVQLVLTEGRVRVGVRRANERRAAGRILVQRDLGVADRRAVDLVVLRVVGLLFVRVTLEVGPGLELHGDGDRIESGRATAPELGLAERRIAVGRERAHERRRVRRIFVIRKLGVADVRAVRLVVLREVRLFFAGDAFEVGPRLELHRDGDRVEAGRAATPDLRLAERGIPVRLRGADERRAAVRIFVVGNLRVANVGAVGLVVLGEVGLFFAGEALVIGPGLELHGEGNRVETGRAATPEFGLAERGICVSGHRAHERGGGVRGILLIIRDRRVTNIGAVGFVILREIGLFVAGLALEIGPRLELHRGGDRVEARHAAAVELRFAEPRVCVGAGRTDEEGGVRRILVIRDLRVAHAAVRLVVLDEVGFFLRRISLEIGPSLERHRGRDRVHARGPAAVELGLTERGIRIGEGRPDDRGRSGRILVVRDLCVADVHAVRTVVLRVVGFFFGGQTLEISPRLELHHRRDEIGAG